MARQRGGDEPSARLTPKGAATRRRILDAATALFGVNGVAGTSTEEVRRAAGVSGSQLYHYFKSKQALVRAVIIQQADAAVGDFTLSEGALNSLDALQAWAEATLERHNGTEYVCDLPTLAGEVTITNSEARQAIVDGYDRWKCALHSGLNSMQERGVLNAGADLDELSEVLLAALHGGSQLATILDDIRPMRAALNAALRYVELFATNPASRAATTP